MSFGASFAFSATIRSKNSGVWRPEVAPRSNWMKTRCASPRSKSGNARSDTLAPLPARNCASLRIARRWVSSTSAVGCDSSTATRQPRSVFFSGFGSESFHPPASSGSGPAMMLNASSRSTALRASGPITEMSAGCATPGRPCPSMEHTP